MRVLPRTVRTPSAVRASAIARIVRPARAKGACTLADVLAVDRTSVSPVTRKLTQPLGRTLSDDPSLATTRKRTSECQRP